jgi:hypothetical protein
VNVPRLRVDDEGRECTRCRHYKPWELFYLSAAGLHGRRSICIACTCADRRTTSHDRRERGDRRAEPGGFAPCDWPAAWREALAGARHRLDVTATWPQKQPVFEER